DLFNINSSEARIMKAEVDSAVVTYRYVLKLGKYFPDDLEAGSGVFRAFVTAQGVLVDIQTDCAPTFHIPPVVNVDSSFAISVVVGKELMGFGQPYTVTYDRIKKVRLANTLIPRW